MQELKMRNLALDSTNIIPVPINSDNVSRLISAGNQTFLLECKCVHMVDNKNSIVINNNADTIEWAPIENVIYMGCGNCFMCYDITVKDLTSILIEDGFVAHEWNPTQDRVVIVNNKRVVKVLVLDVIQSTSTIIGQYNLDTEEDSPFMNVGWGSRDTQFKGTEGKTSKEEIEDSPVNATNDLPRIAWRENGDMFTVSYMSEGVRIFKTFSSDCDYFSTCERLPGLGPEISWNPDGTLLGAVQETKNLQKIVFFEKNGLFRFDFKLRNMMHVERIMWNPTGEILTVWQKDTNGNVLSLWVCRNYNWYLKQNLVFGNNCPINDVRWLDKVWLQVITNKQVISYCWRLSYNSSAECEDNLGAVGAIDGCDLLIVITALAIKPPPYHTYAHNFKRPINSLAFAQNKNELTVVLDDYSIYSFLVEKDKLSLKASLESPVEETLENLKSDVISSVVYYRNDELFVVLYTMSENNIRTVQFDGETWQENNITGEELDKFTNSARFRLQRDGFYIEDKKISNEITSFLTVGNYLLLTSEQYLYFIKTTDRGLRKIIERGLSLNVYRRTIPSGALLVVATLQNRKVVMQTPRGDLETIHPRRLTIDYVEKLLNENQFLQAYKVVRTDSIDTNILYDLNPQRFLETAKNFAESLDCTFLDVFLTQLQDENITQKLYSQCFDDPLPEQEPGKKFRVLDRMIEVMTELNKFKYMQSIVTAFICKGRDIDIENALLTMSELKQQADVVNDPQIRDKFNNLLSHMITLSTVERLYNISLGMDRFDILMAVASRSQLDPLEYIPFLQNLDLMEDNYRNYMINKHLKRNEKALQYLILCDDKEELTEFVKTYNLYHCVLKCVRHDNKWYKYLVSLYAKKLSVDHCYNEAGVLYKQLKMYEEALHCFVQAPNMNEALICISEADLPARSYELSLEQLCSALLHQKKFKEASFIKDKYLNNVSEAVDILLKAHLWSDAQRLISLYQLADVPDIMLHEEVQSYYFVLRDVIGSTKEEFTTLKTRLMTIRNKKIAQIKFDHEGERQGHDPDSDNETDQVSVCSTNTATSRRTTSSTSSTASSRRRRKMDRKAIQIREGSEFENIAIIRKLHLLISEMQSLTNNIYETCMHLLSYESTVWMTDSLHTLFGQLANLMAGSYEEIWPAQMITPPDPMTIECRVYRENIEHLDPQFRIPPPEFPMTWKIRCLN